MGNRIETPLGGYVEVGEAPEHITEKSGSGVMLRFGIIDPRDGRVAEIFLSSENGQALINELVAVHNG